MRTVGKWVLQFEAGQKCYDLYAAFTLYIFLFYINESSKYNLVLRTFVTDLSCSRIQGNRQNLVYNQAMILQNYENLGGD